MLTCLETKKDILTFKNNKFHFLSAKDVENLSLLPNHRRELEKNMVMPISNRTYVVLVIKNNMVIH